MNFYVGSEIPEVIKGLRYISTCGLVTTAFIYFGFLSRNQQNLMSDDDFHPRCSSRFANLSLHYICPLLSMVSFIFQERNILLTNGVWTMLVAIPSCLYWMVYLILTYTKLWNEPYDFTSQQTNHKFLEVIFWILIPLSFVVISFVLWHIQFLMQL